jgi:CBS domain-containing protein
MEPTMVAIRDVMTREPQAVAKDTTLSDVARIMLDHDIGEVLVESGDQLCGLVTDRDIVVRAIADGRNPETTTVDSICTHELITLSPNDSVDDALNKMSEHAVRRLPVVHDSRAVGVVSLGDISAARDSGEALEDISTAPPDN